MFSSWRKPFYLFAICLTLSVSAGGAPIERASSCTSVDLRKTQALPIRDQGKVNWCYAHTAADFLQYLYRLPEPISAADIAIQYNLRFWPKLRRFIQGDLVPQAGFFRSAFRDALGSGYCLEKYFPSDRWVKKYSDGKIETKDLLDSIQEIFDLQSGVKSGFYQKPQDLPFVFEFSEINADLFFEILIHTSKSEVLNELRLNACEGHRVDFAFDLAPMKMKLKGARSFERINDSLDRALPVSIDYFYGVLENRDEFPRKLADLHTSLLYGRRFKVETTECEYLVKNTYGSDCENQNYDPRNECEGGYLWVSESALRQAMLAYEYLPATSSDDEETQNESDAQSVLVSPL